MWDFTHCSTLYLVYFLFQVGRDDIEDMSQLFPRNNNELVQCSGKHKIIGILCGGRLLPSVLIDPFQ